MYTTSIKSKINSEVEIVEIEPTLSSSASSFTSTTNKEAPPATSASTGLIDIVKNKVRGRSRSPSPCPTITPSKGSTMTRPDRQGSVQSPPTSPTTSSLKRPSTSSTVNSEKYFVGRHSNDWLFGGFSVREEVKKMVRKRNN